MLGTHFALPESSQGATVQHTVPQDSVLGTTASLSGLTFLFLLPLDPWPAKVGVTFRPLCCASATLNPAGPLHGQRT